MSDGLGAQTFTEVKGKINHTLDIALNLQNENSIESDALPNQDENTPLNKDANFLRNFISRHKTFFKYFYLSILYLFVIAYFVFASIYWYRNTIDFNLHWCNGYGLLVVLVGSLFFGTFHIIFKRFFKKVVFNFLLPCTSRTHKICQKRLCCLSAETIIYFIIFFAIIIFVILDTANSRNRLISLSGVAAILAFGWIFSKHPKKVNWRPVICGLILQFSFGLITIRWSVGREIFSCVADKVEIFLNFAKKGASFVFSDNLVYGDGQVFAFSALPVIFFFSFTIQVLYYWGVMQFVIKNIGWFLQVIMGTTICESVNSAANTFIGMTESPLLIKPYLNHLTTSEIHAIMCSGFATVSGTVLAAYISFGASAAHLITASVMSAPAALCFSKLFYPETEPSITTFKNMKFEKSQDTSVLDAATKGALAGIPLILGIIANIVAFVSAVAFLNSILSWFGSLVGYDYISFEWILGKAFMPLSWLMGVPWNECEDVGKLIGLKTVVNEFIAYKELGKLKSLSARTKAIATYAICGFSNPGSIGIMIGGLSIMAPEKREQIANTVLRAFVAGSMVCFLTACIAGVLME